jgi:hypothetical protein
MIRTLLKILLTLMTFGCSHSTERQAPWMVLKGPGLAFELKYYDPIEEQDYCFSKEEEIDREGSRLRFVFSWSECNYSTPRDFAAEVVEEYSEEERAQIVMVLKKIFYREIKCSEKLSCEDWEQIGYDDLSTIALFEDKVSLVFRNRRFPSRNPNHQQFEFDYVLSTGAVEGRFERM